MEKDLNSFRDDIRILGRDIGLTLVAYLGATGSRSAHNITWHYHRGCELIFVLGGAVAYEFRQHSAVQVPGGHFLVVPPGMEHRGVQNVRTPASMCGLLLSPDFCEHGQNTPLSKQELRCLARHLALSAPTVCRFSRDLKGVLERLLKAQRDFDADRQSPIVKASLRLWACAVILGTVSELTAPCSPVSHELVAAAQDYLKNHMAEPIQMTDLIKHIGLGPSRLFHLFKLATGLTPNDYLQRLRVEKAKELLASPERTITEVAMETGFSSAQYFSGVFRKYAGRTPREYRQRVWGPMLAQELPHQP
jgi:AraC-like DNA-binding protein